MGDDTVPSSVRAKWVFVFPRKIYNNPGVSCHSLLQGIFPTQGLNLDLLHCRQILYHLNYQGSPIYMCVCVYIYDVKLVILTIFKYTIQWH